MTLLSISTEHLSKSGQRTPGKKNSVNVLPFCCTYSFRFVFGLVPKDQAKCLKAEWPKIVDTINYFVQLITYQQPILNSENNSLIDSATNWGVFSKKKPGCLISIFCSFDLNRRLLPHRETIKINVYNW